MALGSYAVALNFDCRSAPARSPPRMNPTAPRVQRRVLDSNPRAIRLPGLLHMYESRRTRNTARGGRTSPVGERSLIFFSAVSEEDPGSGLRFGFPSAGAVRDRTSVPFLGSPGAP